MRYIIDILAKIGTKCCTLAIKLAGNGHIDFEVQLIPTIQPIIFYYTQRKKINWLPIITFISAIIIAGTIVIATNSIIAELDKEHQETIKK